ncbi:nucleolar protein 12 [Uranotaenia lowii]|uniref:nucleolar protein 12 n=1 Tax=Uranotaenia lowii TaxID=190385 RepID=UPI002479DB1C|nr:nucleolar protein 12 [Uranotaenia lowii]XP_055605374.1 nucleolar protein 12 [Uranotaenia lowii]
MKRKSEGGNKPGVSKQKTEIVFDPEKRKDFLTGFHKRKLHRKKLAQNDIERKVKEETRRIRTEAKNGMKKLYHSFKPIPELAAEEDDEQEYDTENVTVKVVELVTTDLAKQNNWIGENRAIVRGENEEDKNSDQKSSDGEEDNDIDTIPGMEMEEKAPKKKTKTSKSDEDAEEDAGDGPNRERTEIKKGPVLNFDGIRSKKDLNKKLKRYANKSMLKSKAFQQSVRVQQQKQMKKSRRVRHFKEKHLKRKGKLPGDKHRKGRKQAD